MSCGEPTVFWVDGGKLLHRADCDMILRAVGYAMRGERPSRPVRSYRYCKDAEREEDHNRRTYPPDDALLHKCLERRSQDQHLGGSV